MIFLLKNRIFGYFGVNTKVQDTYKNGSGKGINERYQESLGQGYDDELSDLINNFIDRTIVPANMLSKLIGLLEYMLGNPVIVSNSVAMRRKIIQFSQTIYNVKSTLISYQILLRMLGFDTVSVVEYTILTGFDSDLTFDDEVRTFDMDEDCCSEYSIELTGSIPITIDILYAIFRIIEFLEPINARLRHVYYNGVEISLEDGIFDDTFDDTFE